MGSHPPGAQPPETVNPYGIHSISLHDSRHIHSEVTSYPKLKGGQQQISTSRRRFQTQTMHVSLSRPWPPDTREGRAGPHAPTRAAPGPLVCK